MSYTINIYNLLFLTIISKLEKSTMGEIEQCSNGGKLKKKSNNPVD